jgi:hypothetical protein
MKAVAERLPLSSIHDSVFYGASSRCVIKSGIYVHGRAMTDLPSWGSQTNSNQAAWV